MAGFYLNQPDDYFTEIESQRGKMISPIDWAIIESWKDRGIPLHLVLRVMQNASVKPNSIKYYAPALEDAFISWQSSQVGAATIIEPEFICQTCHDTKEVGRKPDNADYDWQLEFVECPHCIFFSAPTQ